MMEWLEWLIGGGLADWFLFSCQIIGLIGMVYEYCDPRIRHKKAVAWFWWAANLLGIAADYHKELPWVSFGTFIYALAWALIIPTRLLKDEV